jgi:hypothetical protein
MSLLVGVVNLSTNEKASFSLRTQGRSEARELLVETLQRPEIQEVEEQRGDQPLHLLPWEVLTGVGAGGLLSALLILGVLCTLARRRRRRSREPHLLPREEQPERPSSNTSLQPTASSGHLQPLGSASFQAEDSKSSSPDLIPQRDPGREHAH